MNENRRHHEATPDHDALASLLRDADPAAGDTGLDAVERARMRQAIAEFATQHAAGGLWAGGWQGRLKPALTAAAVITGVGLAVWTLDRNAGSPSGQVADAGVTAPGSALELMPSAPGPAPETVPEPDEAPQLVTALDAVADPAAAGGAPAIPRDLERATAPASQPENTAVAIANDPSPPDRQTRTIQFIAPRGTRIIWTLDPNFESPIAEREARQEQAQ